ncbi:Fic family protein [Nitrincola sp. A-D6]|uniref:Fic family protein n=1 Tax=Nitrincola sp. A-D6 TaxID=1545442 RepID=UPI00051FA039|nr:Fic family protein [Nitrincola sp. A-D6]KGK42878.1 Fic family protein [Nitrincola sp. A-D6]
MADLFFARDVASSKALSKQVQKGQLIRIRQGIYTDASFDEIEPLIKLRWADIVSFLKPDAILAYRTAFEMTPVDGQVFVVADTKSRYKIAVASSLVIHVLPGNTQVMTTRTLAQIQNSNPTRQLLENLLPSRKQGGVEKSLGASWVEDRLCKILSRRNGEAELNRIRDEAKASAQACGLESGLDPLVSMISALLASRPAEGVLTSELAIATARNEPYDQDRVNLLKQLSLFLKQCTFTHVAYQYNQASWRNFAFFESYFSNYIEGTEFRLDEAEKIIFSKSMIVNRHADSHDVLSVFNQVSDYQEMSRTPGSASEFIQILQERHADLMAERPDKHPGQLKEMGNQAGGTVFVSPKDVIGTLTQGFSLYQNLPVGMPRAIFMQFLIAECHPFDDGNGRVSRIMMNAELHADEQYKLLVPTVHRESYLNGLRQASREGRFKTLAKVFYQLQHYSASIDWLDYGEARDQLEAHQAHLHPDQGIAEFNRHIRQFKFTC